MKNKIVLTVLILAIVFSVMPFTSNTQLAHLDENVSNYKTNSGTVKAPFIYGLPESETLSVLDPVDSRDINANDVIRQVCETLFYYESYSGNYYLVNALATSRYWDATQSELTVTLKEGVYFQDGAKFNATAVKFTFDRILYFINATGTLPDTTHTAKSASLFFDMHGNPILKETVINNEYNVTFILNKPNTLFEPLLAYEACSILHPYSTPATEYLELGTDILVGTGPFVYKGFTPGVQIEFHAYENYWDNTADIEQMIFKYYPDSVTAHNALLNGECHFIKNPRTSFIPTFKADANITFLNMNTSSIYRYFGLNNEKINNTLIRKAIAYAYNYTYPIHEVSSGYAIRAQQFLPPGFPYYNNSFRAPYYNTSIAREAMLMAAAATGKDISGLTAEAVGVNAANDAAWLAKNFFYYKFYIPEGSVTITDMGIAFNNDMQAIGIEVQLDVMDWEEYIWTTVHDPDRLNIFYTGWGPDYMDPFNMIEPLLNNMSSANHLQLQDHQIMLWLWEYEETFEWTPANNHVVFSSRKEELTWLIQNRAINEIYCELAVSYDMVMYAHHKNLTRFPYNIRNHLYFYPCKGSFTIPTPDYPPTSNHPEDITTSTQGSETINWILNDDFGGGQYRIWTNDTMNNYYVWVDWTSWTTNISLNVPINRTSIGIYNYTIEYYDNKTQFGTPDTVHVAIYEDSPSPIPGPNVILISVISLIAMIFLVSNNLKNIRRKTLKTS